MTPLDSLEQILETAERHGARALWRTERTPPAPAPRAVPFIWKWATMRELLLGASRLITAEETARRAFRFVNPGLTGSCTDTLYAGLQCILQGERAPAHRHTAFALRFVMEGSGAYTSVGGERLLMEPADLILTPSWRYHDHQKDSEGAMIWLDGLDVPLFQFLRIGFQDAWAPAREALPEAPPDTNLRYPWSEMRARLCLERGDYAVRPYLDRLNGGPISRTLGARAERLDAGSRSPRRKETCSHVYACIEGRGTARVNDTTLRWEKGDVFAIPSWHWYELENTGTESAFLFSYSDRPLIDALGLFREDEEAAPT